MSEEIKPVKPCVTCGAMDRNSYGKCNPCKKVIAKRSYEKHRSERIARVADYKSKKRAKGRNRCTKCKSLKKTDDGRCQPCADKEKDRKVIAQLQKQREWRILVEQKINRKWFKFLCKDNRYEKSIRISGIESSGYYYDYLYPRCVVLLKEKLKNSNIEFDGYFRVEKRPKFYPQNGRFGIHQRYGTSMLARIFENEYNNDIRKGKLIIIEKRIKKLNEQTRLQKEELDREWNWFLRRRFIKEQEKINGIKPKKPTEEKSTKNFFQLLAAGQAISEYVKEQNNKTII